MKLKRLDRVNQIIITVLLAMVSFVQAAEEKPLALVPYPRSVVRLSDGAYELNSKTAIVYANKAAKQPAEMLAKALRTATGYDLPVKSSGEGILLTIKSGDSELGEEGYALKVTSSGIVITAPKPAGLFYGTQTVRQLLPPEIYKSEKVEGVKWSVPSVEIQDKPRFPWRSFMLDVARNFHGKETVKMLIEQMAQHKMNRFHWHLTDDQGWRIEIKKYPKLTEIGSKRKDTQIGGWKTPKYTGKPQEGCYTQEEIKEIVRFAAARHIMIIPEIGMPGHATAALASYPEFRCPEQKEPTVACSFGKKPYVYNVANERLYAFIEGIIEEIVELFPGNVIHIGGDEVSHGQWKACDQITELMKREGITNYSDVQVYFTNRLVDMIQKKGRRVMGWNEITGDLVHGSTEHRAERKLAKSAVVQFWKGSSELLTSAIESGYDCVNSTHSYTYLDYTYGKIPVKKAYDFNPVPNRVAPKNQPKVIGFGCQMWGEFILDPARLEYRAFPRFCAYGEVGWTEKPKKDFERFKSIMESVHFKRLEYQGIRYAKNVFMREIHKAEEFKDFTKIGEWTKKMMNTEYIFEWDATELVKGNGSYSVALLMTEGKHALAPLWMELLKDGQVIARDDHPALAGNTLLNNVYRFKLDDYEAGSRYTVRMENCKSKGWKTLGDVLMHKDN